MNACRVAAALTMGVLVHGLFACAVGSMAFALATGMQHGMGTFEGMAAVAANALLVLQFPILHSFLLSRPGRKVLAHLSPVGHGRKLSPTTYVVLGSLQLLAVFWGWSPSGTVWSDPVGTASVLRHVLFGAAWLFLVKALWDAGLGLQSGAAGWWALLRDKPVDWGTMPVHGLFTRCRQPIYLGFALVLWTAPTLTPDWLGLTVPWTAYCVLGPLLKEARWEAMFGARFRDYRRVVPYFLPRTFR